MLIGKLARTILSKSSFLSMSSEVVRQAPVIFVIGCTGTGKSDLGVAIAQKYGGEVISVDSQQIYKGLDIATNKITEEEACGIPHHLMSFIDIDNDNYHVQQFRDDALKLIQAIRNRRRVPVIVGGTTYYAESLLYENNMIHTSASRKDGCWSELDEMTNEELWNTLNEVDPVSASLVHPNNRNRVQRAVEIFRVTGKRKSEHLKEQKENSDVDLGGRLRFDESLVLYLDANAKVLEERLDMRVEKMKKIGLKKELVDFFEQHKTTLEGKDHGVMQCIGLKEFIPWLRLEDRESKKAEKLFDEGCNDVKLHTRQYARRQRRWFTSRLVRRRDEEKVADTKMIDTSKKDEIIANGMKIVDEWMRGANFVEQSEEAHEKGGDANKIIRCEICDKTMSGVANWKHHIAGKNHRNQVKKLKDTRAENEFPTDG